jgi:outer membrane protein OmpA-like peptidoglycan-associated protein
VSTGTLWRRVTIAVAVVLLAVGLSAERCAAEDDPPVLNTRSILFRPGQPTPPYRIRGVLSAYTWGTTIFSKSSWNQVAAVIDSQVSRLGADMVVGLITGEKDERYDVLSKWAVGLAVSSVATGSATRLIGDPRVVGWRPISTSDSALTGERRRKLDDRLLRAARLTLAAKGIYLAESDSTAKSLLHRQFGADSSETNPLSLQIDAADSTRGFRAILLGPRGTPLWSSPDAGESRVSSGRSAIPGSKTGAARVIQQSFDSLPPLAGLLDSDRDGVADYRDIESGTVDGATVDLYGRALDDDHDGVPNGIDQHPNTPIGVSVDAWGVPIDADHDGVWDSDDRCPGTAANLAVDSTGCPIELTWIEVKLIDTGKLVEQRIQFATGSAQLLPASFATLDEIGRSLSDLPAIRFEVAGHCDERGSDELNQQLSEARAQAVVDHLLKKFVGLSAEQLTPRGYGKQNPLVPNTSESNMAQNRRVEFVVLNPEKLKRQIEHKRLKQRGE